jgi:hypothetical protein
MNLRSNPEMRGVLAGAIAALLGILLIVVPGLAGMDGMDGGFALGMAGLLVALTGVVTAAIFASRAARLRSILAGQNLLAHWVYPPADLEAQVQRERREQSRHNRILLAIVAGWTLLFVVLFTAMGFLSGQGDSMPLFIGIMLGVLAIVAAFAFGMPHLQARRARRSSGEAFIAADGLYLNGALSTWNPPLNALDGVSMVEDGGKARLVFHLRSRTGPASFQDYTVEVPVPPGQEEVAMGVAGRLQRP